jgi:hypothetical protein
MGEKMVDRLAKNYYYILGYEDSLMNKPCYSRLRLFEGLKERDRKILSNNYLEGFKNYDFNKKRDSDSDEKENSLGGN